MTIKYFQLVSATTRSQLVTAKKVPVVVNVGKNSHHQIVINAALDITVIQTVSHVNVSLMVPSTINVQRTLVLAIVDQSLVATIVKNVHQGSTISRNAHVSTV